MGVICSAAIGNECKPKVGIFPQRKEGTSSLNTHITPWTLELATATKKSLYWKLRLCLNLSRPKIPKQKHLIAHVWLTSPAVAAYNRRGIIHRPFGFQGGRQSFPSILSPLLEHYLENNCSDHLWTTQPENIPGEMLRTQI